MAVPESSAVPVKVAVPALAVKVPLTFSRVEIEKLKVVVIEPVNCKVPNRIVPPPLMVFDTPAIAIVLLLPVNVPATEKLLLIIKVAGEEMVPLMVRS